jgi:hypothetical protein
MLAKVLALHLHHELFFEFDEVVTQKSQADRTCLASGQFETKRFEYAVQLFDLLTIEVI